MVNRIRVYELAKELGLSNKEALDLCASLGIAAKSHSSSIEEPQADRARRKADREGLRRKAPESPQDEPLSEPTHDAAAGLSEKRQRKAKPPAVGDAEQQTAAAARTQPAPTQPAAAPEPAARTQPTSARPAAATEPAAAPEPAPSARPAPAAKRERPTVEAGVHHASGPPPASAASAGRPGQGGPSTRRAASPSEGAPQAPPARESSAGPAGPPRSLSGKPIPPPPGVRRPLSGATPERGPGGSRYRGVGQQGPGDRRPGYSNGASTQRRPGGAGGTQGGRQPGPGGVSGGRFVGPRPGVGTAAPAGPARPGGTGGPRGGGLLRGRQQQRRPRRRKRQLEELEPTQLTAYTASDAPVPDHEVIVERGCTAQDLGPKLNRSAGDVVRYLLLQGEMVTATQSLPDEMIEIFAAEIGARVQLVDAGEEDEAALQAKYFDKDDAEEVAAMKPRPPVVTVMGHVDHGKTMLLDRVRETNVVAQEAGGITQHIGAYQVDVTGHGVTFIDTPGHEAFTAMRARGAQVTDIVVLVVAADDGVMPQTVEAIDHAKAAGTPIVVAINKIDRESADPDRVRQQLSEHGLVPESWGGDTIMVEVSALANTGVSALLEQLLVVAEVEELKANPEIAARAIVLEANLDTGRGPVATVIVQAGTLRVGDYVVAGSAWGRVKALVSDRGENVKEAPPAMPVRLLGFSKPPVAGDELRVVGDQGVARAIAEARDRRARHTTHLASVSVAPGTKLEDVFARIQSGEVSTLNLILKADVQGSLEAITDSLQKLETDEVKLDLIHRGVGGVTENDVQLAAASNAAIIAFNVRPDRRARELAEARKVDIRTYEVIYKVMEDLAAAMKGLLAPTFEEVVTGEAEVRAIFRVPRIGAIAGCMVRNGVIKRGSKVRFLRDGVVIWNGSVSSLRRHKDDVREVAAGFECGIGLSDFQDLHEGDVIETYEEREVEPATT